MARQAEGTSYSPPDVIVRRPRRFGRRKFIAAGAGVALGTITGGIVLEKLFGDGGSSSDSSSGSAADNSAASGDTNTTKKQTPENRTLVLTKAPDFERGTLNGQDKIKLRDYRGKPVLLSFWQTDFPPGGLDFIVKEIEPNFGNVQNISVLTGIVNEVAESTARKNLAANGLKIDFPVVLDQTSSSDTISGNYGVRGTPTYIVINSKGEIFGRIDGFTDGKTKEQLTALLKQASQ